MSSEQPGDQEAGAAPVGPTAPALAGKTHTTIPTSTVVVGGLLVLVVGVGLGFFMGHRADRFDGPFRFSPEQPGSMWSDHEGAARGGASGRGAMMGPAGFEGMIAGTVTAMDGDKLTVMTIRGTTIEVTATAGTQVRLSTSGDLTDLGPGSKVVVVGSPSGAGTFSASRIIRGALPPDAMTMPPSSGTASP